MYNESRNGGPILFTTYSAFLVLFISIQQEPKDVKTQQHEVLMQMEKVTQRPGFIQRTSSQWITPVMVMFCSLWFLCSAALCGSA